MMPGGGSGPAIQTAGLAKRYRDVLALEGLDLAVPEGSIFGLLGPNGAGKTTTLRLLAGLTRPTSGRAIVAGVEVGMGATAIQRRIGVLDQDPRYYGWMTGRELVTLAGRLHGLSGRALRDRVAELLERVALTPAANRRIGGYSGGMRQRIGIAQALVGRPPVLLLDEPVSSLDPEGRRDLLALIATLRGEATVVFSTHVLNDVERVCDRVGILNAGRLVAEAPLGELLERYAQPVYRLDPEPGQAAAVEALAGRLRASAWVTGVGVDSGALRVIVSDVTAAGRELLPTVVGAGVALAGFERQRPDLEEVFLRIVAGDRVAAR
jgi:ABC-2 type transport system ATP-binding protein